MKLPSKKKGISEQLLKLISYDPLSGLHRPAKYRKRNKGGKVYNRDHVGRFASGGAVNGHRPSDVSDKERAERALPENHKLGMKVPKGGSMCANCRFLASPTTCGNRGFVQWNGGPKLPHPAHEYCCDLYERAKGRASGGSVRKPGSTYNTQLDPLDEMSYRQWVKDNNVPTNPDATAPQDYDMRGFWQGLQQQNPRAQSAVDPNDSRLHYPDYWKTPMHETFSNESQWAPANAPQWTDDDKLVSPNGRVIFDDRNPPSEAEKLLTVPAKDSGGRVHMADGGAPVTDPDVLSQLNAPTPVTDPKLLEQLNAPDVGSMTALGRGAAQGATFGFADELSGLQAAGPEAMKYVPIPGAGLMRPVVGAARLAKEYLMGGDQTATGEYEKARDEARAQDELAQKQHPYLHAAGEIAGSIPAMAVLPEGEFLGAGPLAKSVMKGAQVGAEYGGLSGLGEGKDVGDSAMKSAEGIVGGIVGGAAAPVVGAAGSKLVDKFVSPAVGAIRGAINPEAEASRRLAAALQKDQELIASGKAEGMSPQEWINARHAGEPVTLADLGSSNTQALLRSSANTSPEGRAILDKALNDRFYGQTERVANDVRGLVAGGANAGKTGEDLIAAYDKGRKPLYKQAYAEGDKQIMSPAIEQMMGSPSFTKAMRGAVSSGQDRAVTEGYGAFNPGVTIDPGGTIRFNKGPTGVPIFPNLQYWDAVKRQLDDMAGSAMRSGEKGQGGVLSNMANTLRSELDKQVPSYADARGFASKFFGESNALEAGRNLAGKKVDPSVITDAMKKMKPDERSLFQEGYASDWANRVISNISDTRDITKAMFNSPNERARALAVFGPAGMAKIQTRMTLETIMDGARKAMGNSTTARQLIEAGLAGGTLEGYLSGWDPTHMAAGFAGAAGARKALGSEMAAGARQLVGKVDSKTARLVAELLTSNDPTKLSQGIRMAEKNQRIADGLKNIANRVSLAGQSQVSPSAARLVVHPLQGPVPVGAQEKQQ